MAKQPVLIILAGGASSRMWPLHEKSLMRFGTEPLLISQIRRYQTLGFKQLVIVGNPNNKAEITSFVAPLTQHLQINVVVQPEPLGMGDAILKATHALNDDLETSVYITQVHDVVEDQLHKDILAAFKRRPNETYIAGYEMDEYFPGGYLSVDEKGRITDIIEKPGPENRPSNLVNIVAHLHTNFAALVAAINTAYINNPSGDDHYERAMDALMKETPYRVIPYKGFWSALKYPWHVLDIMNHYLEQINGQVIADDAFIAPTATLVGNVFIGSGARVFPGAAVVGPAYVGAGTIVGNNSLVRNSMVLNNCEVGFTTEIARSYVADGCAMHACRVLDSIFAEKVNFSAGCTTANLRIDRGDVPTIIKGQKMYSGRDKLGAIVGPGAFLSVDVMTMPGVKIGAHAEIGPGTHVLKDVLENQRVYVKQALQITENKK